VARIFLSYAREDEAQVRDVYRRLHAIEGFEPWLDEEDLLPGQEWAREIPRALQTSDFILIFFSRIAVTKRGYVQREMKLALDAWEELPEGTIHTIPVRLDDCDVPEQFRRYHWANLFDPSGFDRIVRAIRTELAKRSVTESTPNTGTTDAGHPGHGVVDELSPPTSGDDGDGRVVDDVIISLDRVILNESIGDVHAGASFIFLIIELILKNPSAHTDAVAFFRTEAALVRLERDLESDDDRVKSCDALTRRILTGLQGEVAVGALEVKKGVIVYRIPRGIGKCVFEYGDQRVDITLV
jgi:TIR domain